MNSPRPYRWWYWSSLLVLLPLATGTYYYSISQHTRDKPAHNSLAAAQNTATNNIDAFIAQHWRQPLAPQGKPPAHFSALEASLDPATCGGCHAQQYSDWKTSLHSHTMGPGIAWQLRLLPQADANQCLNCHAPLAEQKALIALEHNWSNAPKAPIPDYVPANLGHQGLVCASCHVRNHQRFGPEPRLPASASAENTTAKPHDGFTLAPAFSDSRFCASCHQFPENGPRTAGKLREDTLKQWQASQWPAAGQQCQSCHMPDRKHQWQGIHSPEMVNRALSVSLNKVAGGIEVALHNSGAGHHFPTYMVPKVEVELWRSDNQGNSERLGQTTIGWQVDITLEHESFDTRIPAGGSHYFIAQLTHPLSDSDTLEVRARVKPREHYERSFLSVLAQADKLDATTLALLQQAYSEARATHFDTTLWQQTASSLNKATP